MRNFGLYIVMTAPELGYRRFAEICVQEEVPIIQLRDKCMPNLDQIALARELKDITMNSNTLFFINDRVDQALLADADGVHLGPEDIPWQEARSLMPAHKLIGVSTHSPGEAQKLIRQITDNDQPKPPDYMSFGPIYSTPAKKRPDPPLGTDRLAEILKLAPIPVVAIGGIFPHNMADVLGAGAKNIAMIRYFGCSVSPAELRDKIRHTTQTLKEQ